MLHLGKRTSKTAGGQLAARAKGDIQPDHASLWPEIRNAHRQMEPAGGEESAIGASNGSTPEFIGCRTDP